MSQIAHTSLCYVRVVGRLRQVQLQCEHLKKLRQNIILTNIFLSAANKLFKKYQFGQQQQTIKCFILVNEQEMVDFNPWTIENTMISFLH